MNRRIFGVSEKVRDLRRILEAHDGSNAAEAVEAVWWLLECWEEGVSP